MMKIVCFNLNIYCMYHVLIHPHWRFSFKKWEILQGKWSCDAENGHVKSWDEMFPVPVQEKHPGPED